MWSMVASMGGNVGSGRTEFVGEQSNDYGDERNIDGEEPPEYEDKSNERKFDWNIDLDKFGRYKLAWHQDESKNEIKFSLSLNTSHFKVGADIFALGFSERGETKSSDFCLFWYDLVQKLHLQDVRTDEENKLHFVEDKGPKVCRLVRTNKKSSGGELEIVFKRALKVDCVPNLTAIRRHFYTIDNGTTHLVWFKLDGPTLGLDGLNLSELEQKQQLSTHDNHQDHSNRGANATVHHEAKAGDKPAMARAQFGLKRLQLIAVKAPSTNSPLRRSSASRLDIRMKDFPIPSRETTYWCKLFRLPSKFESRRYHITSYEAVIQEGNEHVVHHMELFNCANLTPSQSEQLDRLYEQSGGWSGECGSPQRPRETQPCRRVILAWAMGARPLVYPAEVGQSIGGPKYSPYVVLEVHYNNVEQQAGLLDSSGLRFHYSPKLRPFDAGVLEVGLEYTDKNSIPPGMLVPMAGYCVGECTRVAMSSMVEADSVEQFANSNNAHGHPRHQRNLHPKQEGIHIFAAQMHTHLTGVASWTEHVRAGKLLGELQRDNHYSPHFQEIRLLPEPVHVLPGDSLIHYCLHDTHHRVNITLGGFATSDEMCVTYLHYYPKIDLEVCKSSVDTRALDEYFSELSREEGQKTTGLIGSRGSVSDNYLSIQWAPKRSRELLEFYRRAPLSIQCNRSNGERWPGDWNGFEPTKVFWLPDGNSDRHHPAKVDFLPGSEQEQFSRFDSTIAANYRGLESQQKCS